VYFDVGYSKSVNLIATEPVGNNTDAVAPAYGKYTSFHFTEPVETNVVRGDTNKSILLV
jgi:hypothetical protein